jgi:16S rRNA (adenine1518-N6/adenine1519-N6)-dimethyltransferase
LSHRPRKRFGQNFLHDASVIAKVLQAVNARPEQHLVEIGPGLGAITAGLLKRAGKLDAVELDRDLVARLRERFGAEARLEIHQADALRFDFCALSPGPRTLRVVGNLPYNISTPLLFHLLGQSTCIYDMHFMLQKEVVERMAATHGGKTYGRLSVMLQVKCEVTPLFDIGSGAFDPPPKVGSAFVRLRPYMDPPWRIRDPHLFEHLVALAFNQRRKTLRNTLKGMLRPEDFVFAGIDPAARPEQLPPQDFAKLANAACISPLST